MLFLFIARNVEDFFSVHGLLLAALLIIGAAAGIVALIKKIQRHGQALHTRITGQKPAGLHDLLRPIPTTWQLSLGAGLGTDAELAVTANLTTDTEPATAADIAAHAVPAAGAAHPASADPSTSPTASISPSGSAPPASVPAANALHSGEDPHGTPWYAKLFSVCAAWIASFLVLGACGLLLFQVLNLDNPIGILPIGVGLLFVARLWETNPGMFLRHCALAFGIAGTTACFGSFTVVVNFDKGALLGVGIVTCLGACAVLRSRLYHALAAGTAVVLLVLLVDQSLNGGALFRYSYNYYDGAPPVFLERILTAGFFASFLFFAGLFATLEHFRGKLLPLAAPPSPEPPFPTHTPRPFLLGALGGLLALSIMTCFGMWELSTTFPAAGAAAGVGLAFAAQNLKRSFALPIEAAAALYIPALAAGVAGLYFPWLPLGLYAAFFCRSAGIPALNAAPALVLTWCVSAEYYNTDISLLYKSYSLVGVGVALMLTALAVGVTLKRSGLALLLCALTPSAPAATPAPSTPAAPTTHGEAPHA